MIKQIKSKAIIAVALSLTFILSGCAGGQKDEAKTTSTSQSEKQGTRTVKTSKGDVEVPENPKRVIVTYGIGDVLALGVKPVATYDVKGTAYADQVKDLPVWEKFESEEIMAQNPDLILVVNDEQYNEASKIAPTVMVPFTKLTMKERVTLLGEVLNKKEEAKKALADFDQKIADAKKQLTEKAIMGKTISLFEGSETGGVWTFGDKWGRGGDLIYSHLGFKAPDIIQKEIIGKDQYREVSLEIINDYAGDYIVFSGELGGLENNPVWKSIPAVKEGRVIPIDHTLFFDIDIFSSGVQLDYLMEQFTKK